MKLLFGYVLLVLNACMATIKIECIGTVCECDIYGMD